MIAPYADSTRVVQFILLCVLGLSKKTDQHTFNNHLGGDWTRIVQFIFDCREYIRTIYASITCVFVALNRTIMVRPWIYYKHKVVNGQNGANTANKRKGVCREDGGGVGDWTREMNE